MTKGSRYQELWLIIFMVVCGIFVGECPKTIEHVFNHDMFNLETHGAWRATIGSIGVVHGVAWYFNGRKMWWTGPIRAWGCTATSLFVAIMAVEEFVDFGPSPEALAYVALTMSAAHTAFENLKRFMFWRGLIGG